MMGVDAEAMKMDATRDRLAKSDLARQAAVCMFPLKVADMAEAMRRALLIVKDQGESKKSREWLDWCEELIRKEYRDTFGSELGGRGGA